MTDQIREQMSALLDGELPQDEIGLLVRRMERDTELQRAFGSYALIGETLRAPGGTTREPRLRGAGRRPSTRRRRHRAARRRSHPHAGAALGLAQASRGGRSCRRRGRCRRAAAASRRSARRAWRRWPTSMTVRAPSRTSRRPTARARRRRRASGSRVTGRAQPVLRHRWSGATSGPACSPQIRASRASHTRRPRRP